MTPDEVVAANLKRLRRTSTPKLSQQGLASRMGEIDGGSKDRSRVAKIERGLVAVSWRDVVTAAIALGVSVRQIVTPQHGQEMLLATRSSPVAYFDGDVTVNVPYLVDNEAAWDFFASPSDDWKQLHREVAATKAELIEMIEELRGQAAEMRRTRVVPDASELRIAPPPPSVKTIRIPMEEIEEADDGIDS